MSEPNYKGSAQILKALAHPTRIQLLYLIKEQYPCVKAMEEEIGIAQPNISQHLSLLRNIGIIEAERNGNQMCYRIKNDTVVKLLNVLNDQ